MYLVGSYLLNSLKSVTQRVIVQQLRDSKIKTEVNAAETRVKTEAAIKIMLHLCMKCQARLSSGKLIAARPATAGTNSQLEIVSKRDLPILHHSVLHSHTCIASELCTACYSLIPHDWKIMKFSTNHH